MLNKNEFMARYWIHLNYLKRHACQPKLPERHLKFFLRIGVIKKNLTSDPQPREYLEESPWQLIRNLPLPWVVSSLTPCKMKWGNPVYQKKPSQKKEVSLCQIKSQLTVYLGWKGVHIRLQWKSKAWFYFWLISISRNV